MRCSRRIGWVSVMLLLAAGRLSASEPPAEDVNAKLADSYRAFIAKFLATGNSLAAGCEFDSVTYDLKKTDSLIRPVVGSLSCHVTSELERKLEMYRRWSVIFVNEDGKWVAKLANQQTHVRELDVGKAEDITPNVEAIAELAQNAQPTTQPSK